MAAFDLQKAWSDASDLYTKRQFSKCADKLQQIINNTEEPDIAAIVTNTRANVYIDGNDIASAHTEVDKALVLSPNNFQVNYTKARLLYYADNDPASALAHINTAITNYVPDEPDDEAQTTAWVQTYISTRSEIYNLKTSIENDIRSNGLYDQMRAVEDRVDEKLREERMRSIEVIGIFAAILALILTGVQGALNLKGPDFLWLGLGMVVPISFMVLLVSPKTDIKAKTLVQFAVFVAGCIAIGIFIDRWFLS